MSVSVVHRDDQLERIYNESHCVHCALKRKQSPLCGKQNKTGGKPGAGMSNLKDKAEGTGGKAWVTAGSAQSCCPESQEERACCCRGSWEE